MKRNTTKSKKIESAPEDAASHTSKFELIDRLVLENVATGGCGGMTMIDPPSSP